MILFKYANDRNDLKTFYTTELSKHIHGASASGKSKASTLSSPDSLECRESANILVALKLRYKMLSNEVVYISGVLRDHSSLIV